MSKHKKIPHADALANFMTMSNRLVYIIGSRSKALDAIRKEAKIPEVQLTTAYLQEGSKLIQQYINAAMKNFLHVLGSEEVSLADIAVMCTLLFGQSVDRAISAGWDMPPEFLDEMGALFKAGLRNMVETHDARHQRAKELSPDGPLAKGLISVVKR